MILWKIEENNKNNTSAQITSSTRLKEEEGVRLALEAIRRAGDEENHECIEAEEEARLIEEERMKSEEEEQACLRADKEAHLSE